MEEIAEGIGRGALRVLKWIIIDAFIEIVLHGYGRITLKLITLGKYPKPNQDNETFCVVTGLISFVITIAIIMLSMQINP